MSNNRMPAMEKPSSCPVDYRFSGLSGEEAKAWLYVSVLFFISLRLAFPG